MPDRKPGVKRRFEWRYEFTGSVPSHRGAQLARDALIDVAAVSDGHDLDRVPPDAYHDPCPADGSAPEAFEIVPEWIRCVRVGGNRSDCSFDLAFQLGWEMPDDLRNFAGDPQAIRGHRRRFEAVKGSPKTSSKVKLSPPLS